MRITNVAATQHDAERVSIFVDDRYALACHALIWMASGLHLDDEVTDADLDRLRAAEDRRALKDRALGLLARRPRSRAEMQRRLARGTPAHPPPSPDLVRTVLDELAETGLLDDGAFAAYWVEQRDRFRPKGSRALRAELAQQGIARDDAAEAVAPERDLERALAAARPRAARLASQPNMDARTFRDQLGPFLVRRGFGYDVARQAIAELWRDHHADAPGDAFDEEPEVEDTDE
jgi:regulatory protein